MLIPFLAALFGLLIGSFLNVCIYRLPEDLSVVRPRSFCPSCKRTIAWHDNIPVLSYLILGGLCRHCRARIPFRYPLVELLTALAFLSAFLTAGPAARAIKLCVFSAILIELIFSDLETRILPNEFTLGGALAGFLFALLTPMEGGLAAVFFAGAANWRIPSLLDSIIGAGFAAAVLWMVGTLYPLLRRRVLRLQWVRRALPREIPEPDEWLGGGDISMAAMMGSFLGLQDVLLALIVGSFLGFLIGIAYIRLASKSAASYPLPFGSFLGAAALLVALLAPLLLA